MNPQEAPVRPLQQAMTEAEFLALPRRLGWEYAYEEGQAYAMPAPLAVVPWQLTLTRRQPPPETVRSVQPADERALVALYRVAFAGGVESAGDSREHFRADAAKCIRNFFSKHNSWQPAACILKEGRRTLAAALLRQSEKGPFLEPVFVRPAHQRWGLATQVMNGVVNRLLDMGRTELFSQCLLANAASVAWHLAYGFEEVPSSWIAGQRCRFFAAELERRQRLGDLTSDEETELRSQATFWQRAYHRIREQRKKEREAEMQSYLPEGC